MRPEKPATATNEEPEIAHEEDVAVDRKDTEGEEMMKTVHNDKLRAPTPPKGKGDEPTPSKRPAGH